MGVKLLGKIKIHEIAKELNLSSKEIINKANELDGSFEGTSASAFLSSTSGFINLAKNGHLKMSNVKNFLIEVANVMENE